ncbi:MAG: PD-(D/E)XK nuclease family protein [Hyphomicrobiaceae bacterium]|nr:MAG: PD-(D/E)XK nuclease family protein [Hyphomicrobiaceae bacterium]
MTKPFKVSQSKVKTWRKCRRAYHFKYVEKLRRKHKGRPLEFGTIAHAMIEAHLNGDNPDEVLELARKERGHMFNSELEHYGDVIDDLRIIMNAYFDFWDGDGLTFDQLGGKSSELEFECEIASGIVATGKIDGIATSKQKLRWMVEHKTFNHLPSEDERWRNLQSCVYLRVIEMLGFKPADGTLWDYISSKSPTEPRLLKSGRLSEKRIMTLPAKVIETAKKHGLPVRDYRDFIADTRERLPSYFQRIYTPAKPAVIEQVFADFVETSKEMRDCHGKVKARTVDRHCTYCEYEPLCRAQLMGHDDKFIRSKDYETSTRPAESHGTRGHKGA